MLEKIRYAFSAVQLLHYERKIMAVEGLRDLSTSLPDIVARALQAGERALELSAAVNGLPLDGTIERRLDNLRYNYSRYLGKDAVRVEF